MDGLDPAHSPPASGIPSCHVVYNMCPMVRPLNPCFGPPVRPPPSPPPSPLPPGRPSARTTGHPYRGPRIPVPPGPLSWCIMGYSQEMSLLITNKIKYHVVTSTPATTHRPARRGSARQATGWSVKGPWMHAREMDGMPEAWKKMGRCESREAGAGSSENQIRSASGA